MFRLQGLGFWGVGLGAGPEALIRHGLRPYGAWCLGAGGKVRLCLKSHLNPRPSNFTHYPRPGESLRLATSG